jgi:hypothetical protein|tara:strand:+ start:594 stop:1475 length:882 start_codon:yes stop_codon:yes gene_type:complete
MTRQHQSALSRLGFRDPDKEDPKHGLACEYLQEKMRPWVEASLANRIQDHAMLQIEKNSFCKEDPIFDDLQIKHLKGIPQDVADKIEHSGTVVPSDPQLFRKAAIKHIEQFKGYWARQDIDSCAEFTSMVVGPASGAKGFLDVSFRGCFSDWSLTPSYVSGNFSYEARVWPEGYGNPSTLVELEFDARALSWNPDRKYSCDRPSLRNYSRNQNFSYWGEVRIQPTAPELLLQQIEFYANNLARNDMIWVLADFDLSDFKRMASPQFPQLKCFQLGEKFEEWCENRARPEIPEL